MNVAGITIILALMWAAITGTFTLPNLLLGAGIGISALFITREHVVPPRTLGQLRRLISLFGLYLYDLTLSAIRVAGIVLDPHLKTRLRPAIMAIPIEVRGDVQVTILANLVTLTPGTVSIDINDEHTILYVHELSLEDRQSVLDEIREYEIKVLGLLE